MSPLTSTILLSSLATGTIITATSFHWLLAWIGLELNTLAIIPVISKQHHPRATEAATKYFLTQAAASALLLFSSTINAWYTGTWDIMQMTNNTSNILLTMALMMKLGLAPTHFWLPEVLQGTSLMTALIISTWQKLAPMALIIIMSNNLSPTILMTMGIMSALTGGWGGLNQTQTRKIMAYSSIAHLGWMMTITPLMNNLLTLNLIIYLLMTTAMFLTLLLSKSKTLQDMTTLWTLSPTLMTTMMLTLLSLGGLPPLTGFMPKWLILQELTTQNMVTMATILALSALLSLFFYLRLTYIMAMTTPPNMVTFKHKWRFKYTNNTTPLSISLSLSIFMLPMTPLLLL
uniref:NADH-ubiquinone oxidoreductase chain 2 n=1 Tax=Leiocephalus onaneyi TaxID=1892234 RepID=A0A7G8APE6_9SAUR|nr:NADH dehydrogenase subunit 2 [Leiocephalus onaneyi]